MIDRGCHSDRMKSWCLVRLEVDGGEGSGVENVLMLVQISFSPSSPLLCPSITPSPLSLPFTPNILSLHPPITCHPKGVIQTGSLERNGLNREAGLPLFLPLFLRSCVCVCVCVEVKYSLCGGCEAVCQEGRGCEVGSRWTASQLSSLLCSHLLFPALPLYLFICLSFPSSLPLFTHSFSSLFSSSFSLSCLVADGSVGQQQQSRSQSMSKRREKEKGVVESSGGRGERRWGSGIWRAWLRGPLRGSVYVRVVVWWIEEGERQDTIETH